MHWPTDAQQLIASASLAPSSHNTQPWRFAITENGLELYADFSRALPVNDADNRELHISCGCALYNLRVAAASMAIALQLELLPNRAKPALLAKATLNPGGKMEDASLAPWIARRHTYRDTFSDQAIENSTLHCLADAAATEHAHLHFITDQTSKSELTTLIQQADRALWANTAWRAELAQWMRSKSQGEGLILPWWQRGISRFVIKHCNLGGLVAGRSATLCQTSPVIALLTTNADTALDWLNAGQALQFVLLTACKRGLQAAYLNQPIQVPALRQQLQHRLSKDKAQILLRLGYPLSPAKASVRRSIDTLIMARGA